MIKTAQQQQIADYYYQVGANLAMGNMTKTSASIKDIAKALGRGSAKTLPTVGGAGGLVGGGILGGSAGVEVSNALAKALREEGDYAAAAIADLVGGAGLAGLGAGSGAILGAGGGHALGKAGRDAILNALKDEKKRRLFM